MGPWVILVAKYLGDILFQEIFGVGFSAAINELKSRRLRNKIVDIIGATLEDTLSSLPGFGDVDQMSVKEFMAEYVVQRELALILAPNEDPSPAILRGEWIPQRIRSLGGNVIFDFSKARKNEFI